MTPLSAAQIMLSIDRYLGGALLRHPGRRLGRALAALLLGVRPPEVYVLIIPGFAFASEIIPVFSRKAIFGYPAMVAAVTGIGFLSFGVWAHHMFTVGMTSHANTFFALITMAVGIPTGIKIFNWLGTLWGGKIRFATPMLFCLAFLFQFLVAGLTGIMLASVPFDWQLSDSYFVVAHFHYVLLGALVMTIFGALYYWFPKATGRMLSERLGRWHFWLFVIGFHLTFDTMHIPGLLGMPRRIYTYEADRGWGIFNLVSTVGVVFQAAGVLVFLWNVARSLRRGRLAGNDPWDAWTLEWAVTSPPPVLQLREAAGRPQPPAALGFQAPGRSGLEVRMSAGPIRADAIPRPPERWELPERGPVGMICLIIAEAAIFLIFVVAYLFYLGKSATGPQPKDVLDLPIFLTICLLSSSAHDRAGRARLCAAGADGLFRAWWGITIALAAVFLAGTGLEWKRLIVEKGLTIRTNLFGTTFYSLVGLHAFHVTVGLLFFVVVLALALTGRVGREHAPRTHVLAMYWHFVDAVWIVVFTVVYVVGR